MYLEAIVCRALLICQRLAKIVPILIYVTPSLNKALRTFVGLGGNYFKEGWTLNLCFLYSNMYRLSISNLKIQRPKCFKIQNVLSITIMTKGENSTPDLMQQVAVKMQVRNTQLIQHSQRKNKSTFGLCV